MNKRSRYETRMKCFDLKVIALELVKYMLLPLGSIEMALLKLSIESVMMARWWDLGSMSMSWCSSSACVYISTMFFSCSRLLAPCAAVSATFSGALRSSVPKMS